MQILGLGDALVDLLIQLKDDNSLAELGLQKGAMVMIDREKTLKIRSPLSHLPHKQVAGGSVCNTMRTISHLGGKTAFIGKIGDDALGKIYEESVVNAGVTSLLSKKEGLSGSSTILVSPDGERTMCTYLGPAPTITPEEITGDILRPYHYIYVEGYLLVNQRLVCETMRKAKALGLKVALDLANFNIVQAYKEVLEEIVPKYVDVVFCNGSEAKAYTGQAPEEAVRTLADLVDIALVTVGKDGIWLGSKSHFELIPASGGKPVDTTGAGDYFAAGFLYGQSVGASLVDSVRIGSLLSGYVIEVVGTQISNEKWEQIKLKVKQILA